MSEKIVSVYDLTTGEFVVAIKLKESEEGGYGLPENVADISPPGAAPPYKGWTLNKQGSAWELCDDYRRIMLWEKSSALPVANVMKFGESLPATVTAQSPRALDYGKPQRNVWDEAINGWMVEEIHVIESETNGMPLVEK